MRIISPYLLLSALLIPVSSMVGWLAYHKYEVREELEYGLLTSSSEIDIVTLTFSRKDAEKYLDWEHEREFEYQGEMYDVIEQTTTIDSISYRCVWDHAETKVKKQLDALVDGALKKDKSHQGTQLSIQQLFMSLFFEANTEWHSEVFASSIVHSARWKLLVNTFDPSTAPPPPDLV